MPQSSTGNTTRFRNFCITHRRLSLAVILVAILSVVMAPAVVIASHLANDDVPATHGNTTRLINNWTITPAGLETRLGDLPMNSILSPDGHYLLVSNDGAGIQSLQVVATASRRVVQTIPYTAPSSVFIGLAYSPDGKYAYASGGGSDVVHTYRVNDDGLLTANGDIIIGTTKANPFPTGLSISPDGKTLYVANNLANTVAIVNIATKTVTSTVEVGTYPYTTLMSKDGKTVYVSNWGDGTISVLDTKTQAVVSTIAVGKHPNALAFGPDERLFVADANSDAISVVDTESNKTVRTISVALYAHAPYGSSPESLAVSPNGQFLYVVNSGNNDVVVVALRHDWRTESLSDWQTQSIVGEIPTAWYPSSIVLSKNGNTMYVTNAKGRGAGPNDKKYYPNPTRKNAPIVDAITGYNDGYCTCTFDQYSGSMIVGTLSTIPTPGLGLLHLYSNQVTRNDHVGDTSTMVRTPSNPIPVPGGTSPIKHVIYIVKENRTYDQVFGDMQQGNNDSALTLFGQQNTPNLHALTQHYGIFDNFYADAEVSADGHNWTDSANASDYNQKMWPQDYSPGAGRNRGYDFEGGSKINLSAGGYLWDNAAKAGITYRDYGEFYVDNFSASQVKLIPASQASTCPGAIAHSYTGVTVPAGEVLCFPSETVNPATTPALVGHYDPHFRTFDTRYREADRMAEWTSEYKQFVTNNNLPQLTILRLPNDHTAGTTPGALTPQAFVAENDLAIGQVVDTVSHSKYWANTAIFITEDDSQNGPDHVDAHRTEALVVSPYTYHATPFVDHTLYDTAAMVRTMELILGLNPMSQYDIAAMPMWRDFINKANTKTYNALAEQYAPTLVNAPSAYGAQASARMDFKFADATSEGQLNEILWHNIKGANTPYPGSKGSNTTTASDTDG
ncbi:MAG: bifunctional YncE family protein/alkaline phosphatase family protein [Ktedonobacteraceae bacterium]|nr:bifunctional YncE family protein/alkaline phosphatase family protein [Ktedonobacteraceae bacterium]